VYSKEVETTLLQHPAVADCAIIGLPDPVYEERVVAVVVTHDGFDEGPALVAELQSFVRANLAGYNTPREVHFLAKLPKSVVGKTLKTELRAMFGATFEAARAASG
jgi:acyl-coenzyme A synthetase/AMP-(fatty) acid ligase